MSDEELLSVDEIERELYIEDLQQEITRLNQQLEDAKKELAKYQSYFEFLVDTAQYYPKGYEPPEPAELHLQWSWIQRLPGEEWMSTFQECVDKWKAEQSPPPKQGSEDQEGRSNSFEG